MNKYIDSEKLFSEIVSQIDSLPKSHAGNIMGDALRGVLVCITSLQQEQPEVDLEKEMDKFYDSPLWEGENVSWMTYTRIARHFYELGLNARKEE